MDYATGHMHPLAIGKKVRLDAKEKTVTASKDG